ncbi:MAG: hypothetical protein JSV95_03090 [Gemmatimonadota bacterium]|nr:MAG: hypothetical protein JSV95_03090 [Gemmatimonadota bacterium]
MGRVRALMADWSRTLGVPPSDQARWLAVATLHDALRDADVEALLPQEVYPAEAARTWPRHLLHGPACAHRLARDGVDDQPLLRAVAYHTSGHPELDEMGEYLYLADFLDPGRDFMHEERARLRGRLPGEREEVLLRVIDLRIRHLLHRRSTVLQETVAFWNRVVRTG